MVGSTLINDLQVPLNVFPDLNSDDRNQPETSLEEAQVGLKEELQNLPKASDVKDAVSVDSKSTPYHEIEDVNAKEQASTRSSRSSSSGKSPVPPRTCRHPKMGDGYWKPESAPFVPMKLRSLHIEPEQPSDTSSPIEPSSTIAKDAVPLGAAKEEELGTRSSLAESSTSSSPIERPTTIAKDAALLGAAEEENFGRSNSLAKPISIIEGSTPSTFKPEQPFDNSTPFEPSSATMNDAPLVISEEEKEPRRSSSLSEPTFNTEDSPSSTYKSEQPFNNSAPFQPSSATMNDAPLVISEEEKEPRRSSSLSEPTFNAEDSPSSRYNPGETGVATSPTDSSSIKTGSFRTQDLRAHQPVGVDSRTGSESSGDKSPQSTASQRTQLAKATSSESKDDQKGSPVSRGSSSVEIVGPVAAIEDTPLQAQSWPRSDTKTEQFIEATSSTENFSSKTDEDRLPSTKFDTERSGTATPPEMSRVKDGDDVATIASTRGRGGTSSSSETMIEKGSLQESKENSLELARASSGGKVKHDIGAAASPMHTDAESKEPAQKSAKSKRRSYRPHRRRNRHKKSDSGDSTSRRPESVAGISTTAVGDLASGVGPNRPLDGSIFFDRLPC